MKNSYPAPDRKTSHRIVALVLTAGLVGTGADGCKLGGPSPKEYDTRTVEQLADARDADACPVGDDVQFTDVGLEEINAPGGRYNVVGSGDVRFEVLMADRDANISGATFIVRGTVEGDPCSLLVESYQQTG